MLLPAKARALLLVQQNPLSGTKTFSQKRYPPPSPLPQLALLSFPQLSGSFPYPPYHLSVLLSFLFCISCFSLSCRLPGFLWSKPVCLCLSAMSQPVCRRLSLLSQPACMGLSQLSLPACLYLFLIPSVGDL
jgi:hypothetical protein